MEIAACSGETRLAGERETIRQRRRNDGRARRRLLQLVALARKLPRARNKWWHLLVRSLARSPACLFRLGSTHLNLCCKHFGSQSERRTDGRVQVSLIDGALLPRRPPPGQGHTHWHSEAELRPAAMREQRADRFGLTGPKVNIARPQ